MVEVKRKKGETFDALLRRFQRRVQQGGITLETRRKRYHTRDANKNNARKSALRRVVKSEQYAYLTKTGQLKEEARPRRSHS